MSPSVFEHYESAQKCVSIHFSHILQLPRPLFKKMCFLRYHGPVLKIKAPNEWGRRYSTPPDASDPIKHLTSLSIHVLPKFSNCPAPFSQKFTNIRVGVWVFTQMTPNMIFFHSIHSPSWHKYWTKLHSKKRGEPTTLLLYNKEVRKCSFTWPLLSN